MATETNDRAAIAAVLGPARVRGVLVTPKQRALVAALALAGPNGTCIEKLADAVWGDTPPRSARSSLQNQMSRLRQAHGDEVVTCTHGHYRLGLTTDVARFENLIATADSCGDDAVAGRMLTEAIGLWRGTPFHDLAESHGAAVERARLEELRTAAVERIGETAVNGGDPASVVGLLRQELEADPYRERLWEILMRALHLSDRTADALRIYGDYVERLAADLGATPSQPLVELAASLARGERLRPEPTAQPSPSSQRPPSCTRRRVRARCRTQRQH